MKTINSYNFSEILNGVKNGQVSNIYIICSQTFEDDANGETQLKWDNEPYFAGATIEEATEAIEDVASITSPDYFEYVELDVRAISVNVDTFSDMDDDDDAEDIILDFAHENADDAEYINDDLSRRIEIEYENLDGAILVYWSWHNYIGYARTFQRFDLCNDIHMTSLSCKPSDSAFRENCEVLISPAEVKACKNASELRELMNDRMAKMKSWSNDYNVDEFLKNAYENSRDFGYELPENDLFNDED